MKVIIMFLLIFPVSSYAEIILHGTKQAISLGTSSTYDLHQHLGQTIGSNLFHTFDSFNLNQGETAHFSGANSIQNIVARVIGGEASFIDGALKSSIPNADLYFLNPYGIMLGANARLDLQGGLHLSTADYVRLGDEGEFHARFPERDILTTASISSFGFLTDSPAPISITGKEVSQDFGEKYEDDYTKAPLQLREQQPFSLIGGEINISSDYYYESDENRQNNIKTPMPFMHIPQGQVGFIATNAVGEISINNIEELLNTNQFADISLSDTKIKNSGGGVFVYGNNVTLTNSELHPWIDGNIEVRGNTSIFAADIFFDSVLIESSARNVNDAGNITLDSAGGITLQGSSLYADSGYQVENGLGGNAGKIKLGAQQGIQLTNSEISSTSYGAGDADNITLDSAGDITLQESILYSNSEYETENDLGGNAGNILLKSIGEITLLDTRISSTTWNNGNAGEIKLDAQKGIGLTNSQVYSITERTGNAGNITLDSIGDITLQSSLVSSNSQYETENDLGGNAGNILLKSTGKITLLGTQETKSEISSSTWNNGDAGNIILDTVGDIMLQDSNLYSVSNSQYETASDLGGNAGNVLLKSMGEIALFDILISSTTWSNGNAGEIKLDAQQEIGLTNSQVYSMTERTGNAGNITLDSIGNITLQSSLVSSNSQYETASDLGGNAGNILLKSTGKITLLGTQETKSEISSSTWNNGDAGNIILDTVGDIMLQDSNLYSDSNSQYETASDLGGNAGNILLKSTGKITLLGIQELLGTQEANSITSDTLNNGNAGEIKLDAQQGIEITNLRISNIAYSTGDAGDIILDSIGDITLQSSNLHSDSQYTTASDLGGNAGSILLKNTGKITLLSSQITSQTLNAGNAGEIKLNAQQGIELTNSTINTITHRTGNAGNITLDSVGDITLQSSNLYSNSQYQTESGLGGNAGNILLKSIGKITLLGTQEISEISSITWNNGDAGNIILDAQQGIELTNSTIFNTTVRTGNAGNITLDTTGDITLQSSNLHSDSQYTTASDLGGNAGNILLKSIGEITLLGTQETESTISSTTWNNGNAGNITLDSVGDITLQISTLYSNSQSKAESGLGGNAGNMYLTSQTGQIILKNALNLEDYTGVSSSTWNNGQAGNITLTAARMIGLFDKVEVTTSAEAQEQVDGGKINLKSNFIVTTGESIVDSTAKLGDGGVININAISTFDYNQRPINKVFDITSEQGIDGEIQIDTIDSLNSEALENLPSELIVTDLNFELSCLNQDTSSFRLIPRSGIATRAHDWQSAH